MPLDPSTQIQILGVNCWDEGAQEEFTLSGIDSNATRTILCAWEDRIALINAIQGGGFIRFGMYAYDGLLAYPDAPALYFDRINVEGIPGEDGLSVGPNGLVAYKYARCKIRYKALPYQNGTQVGVLSVNYGVEVKSIPNDVVPIYQFSDGTTPQTPIPFRMGSATVVFKRFNLTSIPTSTYLPLLGCVNSGSIFGADAGQILFDGASSSERMLSNGSYQYDITYTFKYRQYSWNYELCTAGSNQGQWLAITKIMGGSPLYPTADLTPLIS